MSSSEFTRWKIKLQNEPNEFHREDWYIAQLTAWLARYIYGRAGVEEEVDTKDFLLKFYREGEEEDDEEVEVIRRKKRRPMIEMTNEEIAKIYTPEEVQAEKERLSRRSRMFWMPLVYGPGNLVNPGQFQVIDPNDPDRKPRQHVA